MPILTVLAPRVVERLAREAGAVEASAGTAVVVEGQPGDGFFVVGAGRLEVRHGSTVVRELAEGGWFFGQPALFATPLAPPR